MKKNDTNQKTGYAWMLTGLVLFSFLFFNSGCKKAEDKVWPTYRFDNSRSGVTTESVSIPLSLNWVYTPAHPPVTAWHEPAEELPRMHIDNAHHVTAANDLAFFSSSVDNKVYALDSSTGEIRWTFYTGGPVRNAPAFYKDRIYVGSDDGYVYCLQAQTGTLLWKYRAGPTDEKIIGKGRLISLWPVRTNILLDEGVVYFAAGIFPYEGLYICALDAITGKEIWVDDTTADLAHELQYGGFSPQSYLLASDDILYVPTGRALPAAFDKHTGEFLFFASPGDPGKGGGTWAILDEDVLIAGSDVENRPSKFTIDARTGERMEDIHSFFPALDMVLSPEISYTLTDQGIMAIFRTENVSYLEDMENMRREQGRIRNSLRALFMRRYGANGELDAVTRSELDEQILEFNRKIDELESEKARVHESIFKWSYTRRSMNTLIKVGNVLFAGGENFIVALDVNTGEEVWQDQIDGKVFGLSAAGGRVFASTDKGTIYCYTEKPVSDPAYISHNIEASPYPEDPLTPLYESAANTIISEAGVTYGYILVLGSGTGRLVYELANRTDMTIVGIEKDPGKVRIAKEKLDRAGLYGSQAVVERWDLTELPDYFANLVVSDDLMISGRVDECPHEMFRVLKPYGGVGFFGQPPGFTNVEPLNVNSLNTWLQHSGAQEAEMTQSDGAWATITRGELKGAGTWTQQYGNSQNTANSGDDLVHGRLGVLWFGDPGPRGMLNRHARAASPVSMDGRLFVQGEEFIQAYDAYNGSLIWEKEIPGAVRARADSDSGNLVLSRQGLFVAVHDQCYRLDPATGELLDLYTVPSSRDGKTRRWGYITYSDGILYGSGSRPLVEDYAAVYDDLIVDGRWKDPEELSFRNRVQQELLRSSFPEPGEDLRRELHRTGILFRTMGNWPRSGEYTVKGAVTDTDQSASDQIFAIDVSTGKYLWVHDGSRISNIAIAVADGKVFLAESDVRDRDRQHAIAMRHRLTEKGIYKVREDILKDLREAETEMEFLMSQEDPDSRYIQRLTYRVNTLKEEMFQEESEAGVLTYDDADIRMVMALDARTGEKLWGKPVDLTGSCGDRMGVMYYDNMLFFAGNLGNHDAWRFWHGSLKWRRITALSADNGEMIWSRALNYRTRPLIAGGKLIIEPRACDPYTGDIIMRTHPVTGEEVPWEFLRPGHTCAQTSASSEGLFYRSGFTAFYDLAEDRGVTHFGGIRQGCLINMIPANGVLLMPEASSGCTCAYPLRTTITLRPKAERTQPWTVFVTHGSMTPARHFAINLGAPADFRDDEGMVWFGYPNPRTHYHNHFTNYGVKFDLKENIQSGRGFYSDDFKRMKIEGTDKPWIFSSGSLGVTGFEVPLIDDLFGEQKGVYSVRLGFKALMDDRPGQRIFDIKLQDEYVLRDFDIIKETESVNSVVIKEFSGIPVNNTLKVELVPKRRNPGPDQAPVINSIEAIREDLPAETWKPEHRAGISKAEVETLLAEAESDLNRNNYEKALENFHAALDHAYSDDQIIRALNGLSVVASPESLSHLTDYCRDVTPMPKGFKEYSRHLDLISFGRYYELNPDRKSNPQRKVASIVWDYNEPSAEVIFAGIRTFVAIANNIAADNPEKAVRMLKYAFAYADDELYDDIVMSLGNLGVVPQTTRPVYACD